MANSSDYGVPDPADSPPAGNIPDVVGDLEQTTPEPSAVLPSAAAASSASPEERVEVLQVEEIRANPAWLAKLRRMWGRADPATELPDDPTSAQPPEVAGAQASPVPETVHSADIVEVVVGAGADPHRADPEPATGAAAEPAAGGQAAVGGVAPASEDEGPVSATAQLLAGLSGLSPDNDGPGAAAFFDVDNTTIRGSSFVALARGMADRDYFTTAEIVAMSWKQLKFVVSGTENLDDIAEATENGLEFVKGRDVTEIQTLSDEVYDEKMVNRLWAGTLALTEAHLAAGHQVWLVSATPREVAEVIAARLGLTGGLGTVAEVVDGRYTGKLAGRPLHGQAKADVVVELAASHGLDLARCSAYSDSANDIPMLSVVGHPVAINPDSKLRAYAKKQGWPIRDYRFRGKESVRKGLPAAAAAGLVAGAAVGVAKGVSTMRGRS